MVWLSLNKESLSGGKIKNEQGQSKSARANRSAIRSRCLERSGDVTPARSRVDLALRGAVVMAEMKGKEGATALEKSWSLFRNQLAKLRAGTG